MEKSSTAWQALKPRDSLRTLVECEFRPFTANCCVVELQNNGFATLEFSIQLLEPDTLERSDAQYESADGGECKLTPATRIALCVKECEEKLLVVSVHGNARQTFTFTT